MRPESRYHQFDAQNQWVANVYALKWKELAGTNGETRIPEEGTVDALFHVQGRAKHWPNVFPGDDPRIKFFSIKVAEQMKVAGLTGIDLEPVFLRLGNLRSLKTKADQCPGYMWGRITGTLLVDIYVDHQPWPLDTTGMFQLERRPVGARLEMKIRAEQPLAADFCRVVPGGTGHIAISKRAVAFFDELELPEVMIAVQGNGFL